MPTPRMDTLESRRLFAASLNGVSSYTGAGYQSVDKIVTLRSGAYVTAGTFSTESGTLTSPALTSDDQSNLFLQLVNGNTRVTQTLGADDGSKLKFKDDRVDFVSLPRRVDDQNTPLGVSTVARRADQYISQMKIGPDGKLYIAVVFKRDLSLDTQNSKARTLQPNDAFEKDFYDSAILRYNVSGGSFVLENIKQISGPFNDVVEDFAFDTSGNLLVTGSFERDCDFDPTRRSAIYQPVGRGDAFVAKYDGTSGKLRWVAQFGSDADVSQQIEAGFSIAPGANNTLFVGGTLAGKAEFHLNGGRSAKNIAKAEGDTDAFTMRLNADGTLDWVRLQGGDDYAGIRAVTPATGDGVYSVGYFSGDADVDPRADHEQIFSANDKEKKNSDTPTDLLFTRFDADGNVVIVKQLSGTGYEVVSSAATDSAGDLVLAGSFAGTLDFDPSRRTRLVTTPNSDNDDPNQSNRDNSYAGFVAVYRSDSKLRNLATVTGLSEQDAFINGASIGSDGRIAIAGRYRGGYKTNGLSISTNTDFDDYREDGYSLIFNSNLTPIT